MVFIKIKNIYEVLLNSSVLKVLIFLKTDEVRTLLN